MNIANNHDILNDIAKAAVKHASRPAMVIEDVIYTYNHLFDQVESISRMLRNRKENVIGITAENRMETYASILAVLLAGKTYVILHPEYPTERNRRIAHQAEIGLLLHSNESKDVLPPDVAVIRICTTSYEPDGNQGYEVYHKAKSDTPAYIIFTSGSTGEPKGVPISRLNLNSFYSAYQRLGWKLDENDRMLQMFELTFDVSVVSFLYPLTLGACIYTVPQGGMKYLNVLDIMERYRLTFATIAPSVLRLAQSYFKELRLDDLRYMVVTAEATDVSLLAEFRPCIPNATVVNLYGPTEATIYCTSYVIPPDRSKQHNGMAAIGKPFTGMEAIIVDEANNRLPNNQTGELCISGMQVMQGYWNAPDKSAKCFIRHKNGKLYYRTGDLCYLDAEGDIIYCGRKDTQVKIQGFRIELSEIEYCAKTFYNHNTHSVALPVYSTDGYCELHLAIEQEENDLHGLEQYLQQHLPLYMIPKQIHFLPYFPLNGSNKTDNKQLLEIIQKQR